MSDRADIRPHEDLYDRIDRLVDEDPIELRDLAWMLLAQRDAAEARGYRKAINRLRAGNPDWHGFLIDAADYLEAEATR